MEANTWTGAKRQCLGSLVSKVITEEIILFYFTKFVVICHGSQRKKSNCTKAMICHFVRVQYQEKKVFLFSSNKYYQLMFINISHAIKHDCFLFQQWLKNDNHTKNYYINFCFYVQQCSSECVCIHSSPIPMVSREVRRWHWKIQNWRYRGLSVDTWEQSVFLSAGSSPAPHVHFEHMWDLNSKHKGFEHLNFALF